MEVLSKNYPYFYQNQNFVVLLFTQKSIDKLLPSFSNQDKTDEEKKRFRDDMLEIVGNFKKFVHFYQIK